MSYLPSKQATNNEDSPSTPLQFSPGGYFSTVFITHPSHSTDLGIQMGVFMLHLSPRLQAVTTPAPTFSPPRCKGRLAALFLHQHGLVKPQLPAPWGTSTMNCWIITANAQLAEFQGTNCLLQAVCSLRLPYSCSREARATSQQPLLSD